VRAPGAVRLRFAPTAAPARRSTAGPQPGRTLCLSGGPVVGFHVRMLRLEVRGVWSPRERLHNAPTVTARRAVGLNRRLAACNRLSDLRLAARGNAGDPVLSS
jgi:hypothetical protein